MTTALALPPRAFLRRVRLLEHLSHDALMSHAIAVAMLLPNMALGSSELSRVLDRLGAAVRERCERLFVRAPSVVRAEDIEDDAMRSLLLESARGLVDAHVMQEDASPELCVIGCPQEDRIVALLCELERAPLGSAIAWMLLAELLGATVRCRGSERAVLAEYRNALALHLASFADQPSEIFLRALVADKEKVLQAQLRAAVDALRAAASLH